MENQELLEQLQQLQRSLQDIDAARQMVNETIEAYNGVSSRIESYSTQLSSVSDRISQLITLISQNRDTLSSDIDTRMDAALQKAEQISDRFTQKTSSAITTFEHDAQDQIRDLNTAVTNMVSEAHRAISLATGTATELQTQSVIALETATNKVNAAATEIGEKVSNVLLSSMTKTRKSIIISTIIVSVLVVANIIISLLH